MSFWSVWATLLSFGSLGILLAIAVLAPSVLPVIAEYAKPVVKQLGELTAVFLHWLVNILRVGAPQIARSVHASILVGILLISVWVYKDWTAPEVDTPATCQQVVKQMRKDFTFVKRDNKLKLSQPSSWFGGLF